LRPSVAIVARSLAKLKSGTSGERSPASIAARRRASLRASTASRVRPVFVRRGCALAVPDRVLDRYAAELSTRPLFEAFLSLSRRAISRTTCARSSALATLLNLACRTGAQGSNPQLSRHIDGQPQWPDL
jgi:hypothetical protein